MLVLWKDLFFLGLKYQIILALQRKLQIITKDQENDLVYPVIE